MSETTKRAEIADGLRHLLRTSATCIVPYREAIAEFVDALMDATKAEIREELAPTCYCTGIHYDSDTPDTCTQCGKRFPESLTPQGGAAPAPVAYATCQCREPELYVPADGGIICNQCGYEYTADWSKLPSRAPRRDFGAHVCLCRGINTADGNTCLDCKGRLDPPIEMPFGAGRFSSVDCDCATPRTEDGENCLKCDGLLPVPSRNVMCG